MKILVIEDEPDMLDNMVQSLQQEMYIVEKAQDYLSAREKLGIYEYDCILLDTNEQSENSTGIGLAIVKAITELYPFNISYSYSNMHTFTVYFR